MIGVSIVRVVVERIMLNLTLLLEIDWINDPQLEKYGFIG